jgi:hypothetical protein
MDLLWCRGTTSVYIKLHTPTQSSWPLLHASFIPRMNLEEWTETTHVCPDITVLVSHQPSTFWTSCVEGTIPQFLDKGIIYFYVWDSFPHQRCGWCIDDSLFPKAWLVCIARDPQAEDPDSKWSQAVSLSSILSLSVELGTMWIATNCWKAPYRLNRIYTVRRMCCCSGGRQ